MQPSEAKAEYDKIMREAMADPKHPYMNNLHPEHKAVVERMASLYAMMHPQEAGAAA